jgi:hypothetical protein
MFKGAEKSVEFKNGFGDIPVARSAVDRVDPVHNQSCRWARQERTRARACRLMRGADQNPACNWMSSPGMA